MKMNNTINNKNKILKNTYRKKNRNKTKYSMVNLFKSIGIKFLNKKNIEFMLIIITAFVGVFGLVLDITKYQSDYRREEKKEKEKIAIKEEFVQNLTNDLSMNYIDYRIGEPEYSYVSNEIINAFYLVNENVIKCMFDNQRLIGYLIIINNNNPINYETWISDESYLGKFSYDEISSYSKELHKTEYAFSADTSIYRYYFEIYKGAMFNTNGEYYLVGSYMDKDVNFIMTEFDNISNSRQYKNEYINFYLDNKRHNIKPNVYGQIKEEYIDMVKFIDEKNINSRNMTNNIFNSYIMDE